MALSESASNESTQLHDTCLDIEYALSVDPYQDDRATEIRICSCARPHMRAFHYAWISFFIAFFNWFSIPPLMPTIKRELSLSNNEVNNSDIAVVASSIIGRILIGPLCDQYGSRTIQFGILIIGAISVACVSVVADASAFIAVRFMVGFIGSSFIATTSWTSAMFGEEVVGTANAIACGWGNLGAGVSYLLMPLIFNVITSGSTISDDLGWRLSIVLPVILLVITGVCLYRYSDDCPRGNFADLKRRKRQDCEANLAPLISQRPLLYALVSIRRTSAILATWILAFQYACSFGVEIHAHNILSLYYYEDFLDANCDPRRDANNCRLLSQTTASLISSLFGLMCVFARALGGYVSDVGNRNYGITGRILAQFGFFLAQAVALYVYSQLNDVISSIPVLIVFGILVQACTGTTFSLVPYVASRDIGATSGIVGAAGNIGALGWSFLLKGNGSRASSFSYISMFVVVAATLCLFMAIEDGSSFWTRIRLRLRTISR